MQKINIKKWYCSEFKDDNLGKNIKGNINFSDLLSEINKKNGKNIYDFIGVQDSIIRERIFSKLSYIMNVDYDYIYNKWLNN